MKLPNLLVIGAHKAGSSSLYHFLAQHPDIYMSQIKELRFFNKDLPCWQNHNLMSTPEVRKYSQFFEEAKEGQLCGEATTAYLSCPNAPQRINKLIPQVKLLATLRHPVDRAYAHFNHEVRLGRESGLDFYLAMKNSSEAGPFNYRARGMYFSCLKRYYNLFDKDQVLPILFEDLTTHVQEKQVAILEKIFSFLSISSFDIKFPHSNPGWIPKFPLLGQILFGNLLYRKAFVFIHGRTMFNPELEPYVQWPLRLSHYLPKQTIPPLDLDMRGELTEYFRDDILHLQDLIQTDLSSWLN
ncbi:MAG: sulfotransferase domain-containing protein [Cyanobacteriota bacterium]|nr:sulfotransferase domain-containing protein [Cyanobacteriota bacterium]